MTLMACTWGLQAQTRTYHGKVVDAANNEPLIGATIMPVGGGTGAAADLDGNFTVTVPANVKTAKVSYVGYTSQTVNLANDMTVRLASSATSLDDVVVVAYGTANKESLTGSVAVVGAKDIEDRPVTSVTAALEGNAPGVQVNNSTTAPGGAPDILIRGFNSITGSSAPLTVVDGVPYQGSVADLNPADIESMSVLKDAASCALYGNRGANGVILVTTKRAKNVGKVDVTLQIRQGMYNRGLPFYDRLDANKFMETGLVAYANGLQSASPNSYPDYQSALNFGIRNYVTSVIQNNIWGVPDDEVFNSEGRVLHNVLPGYTDLDWWKPVSQNGHRQEYNINVAGATEKYNVFASVGYLKENGYMLNTDFERFNARINANFNPVSYFKFGVNLSSAYQTSDMLSTNDANSVENPFLTMFMSPVYPYYQHDPETGNIIYNNGQPVWNRATYLQGNNVAYSMRLDDSSFRDIVLDGTIYGTAVIPYGFELTVRGSMHRDMASQMSYGNNILGSALPVNGRLERSFVEFDTHTFMQTLNWAHEYGDHHVDVVLDHENYNYKNNSTMVTATNQAFPDVKYLMNFSTVDPNGTTEYMTQIRTESYLGRVRYNYDQKYFGEFSLRRDGSSRFADGNRWGTFWSVGASWILSKEKFMHNLPWVNYLKLRAAYGSVGNDQVVSAYATYPLYASWNYDGQLVMIPGSLAANDIRWESTKTLDLALEGSLFNDRFNFSIGYFDKTNADLLYNVTMPMSMGSVLTSGANASIVTNVGTMKNYGWELSFGVDIIRNRDFYWNFNVDATLMKNKIKKLPGDRDLVGQGLFLDHSLYEKFTYEWAGVDQLTGRSLYHMAPDSPDYRIYYNEDGTLDEARNAQLFEEKRNAAIEAGALVVIDGEEYTTNTNFAGRRLLGTTLPTVFGSFGTNLRWKGISLGLLFTYSLGGSCYDSNYASLMRVESKPAAMHKDLLNAWTSAPEGMTADSPNRIDPNGVPQLNSELSQFDNASSSRWYTNRNWLCLKNINLSYDLPQNWVSALKLSNINLGVSIDNLFIVTARKGLSPQNSWGGGQGAGYVPARVFSFQLGARF